MPEHSRGGPGEFATVRGLREQHSRLEAVQVESEDRRHDRKRDGHRAVSGNGRSERRGYGHRRAAPVLSPPGTSAGWPDAWERGYLHLVWLPEGGGALAR